MATKTAFVKVRVEPDLKENVQRILSAIGLSESAAISLFYRKICREGGIPFDLKINNPETLETFAKTDRGEELTSSKSANEMFEKLEI